MSSRQFQVTRGITLQEGVPFDIDDLNALGLPAVSEDGSSKIGTADIDAGAITAALTKPGAHFYASLGGVVNAYTLTLSPSLASLANGAIVHGKLGAALTNTGDSTLAVNGLTATGIKRMNGAPIEAGDLRANQVYSFVYNSEGPYWILVNPSNPVTVWGGTTAGTDTAFTATPDDALIGLVSGMRVVIRMDQACGAAPTLAVSGLTAKSLRKNGDEALAASDLAAGQVVEVIYDATANGAAGGWMVVGAIAGVVAPTGASGVAVTVDSVTGVSVTVDEVVLHDSAGTQVYRATTVSESASITTSGAGGLDTGSEASATWYYLWLIWNGSSLDLMLSASASAPTMPSGYTFKVKIGAVYNDAGGDLSHRHEYGPRKRFISADTAAGSTDRWDSFTHGLGALPSRCWAVLVCTDAGGDAGYAEDDEVAAEWVVSTGTDSPPGVMMTKNSTTVKVGVAASSGLRTVSGTTFSDAYAAMDETKWSYRVYAEL